MRAQLLAIALVFVPLSASAAFHLWDITEVYSNADGTVQFVEFETCNNVTCNGEQFVSNHTLTSNSTVFNLPNDLPGATMGHHFLIATPAFASQPGAVTPDFTFPAANFMSTVADTINWSAGTDVFTYNVGALPTNGVSSLNEPFGSNVRTTAANTPTNFAGQVGPEPSAWLLQLAGAATVFGLGRRRRRPHRR